MESMPSIECSVKKSEDVTTWLQFLTAEEHWNVDETGLCLPPAHAKYLFYLSFLSIFSGCFALYRGYWDLACVPLGVGLNSLNYWRNPDYSWRRYIDMVYIAISCMWQCLRALDAENNIAFYTILAISIIAFYLATVYYKKGQLVISTGLHSIVHIAGNISNIVLYAGFVPPLRKAWFVA